MSPLRRRRRTAARTALYVSLAVVLAATAGFYRWLETSVLSVEIYDWRGVDYAELPEVQLLRQYIAIDTSLPDGEPRAGAEFLAERLRRAGVPVTVEPVGEKDVNLWAVLEGDDPRAVVLHHHIDVDPVVKPELWSAPPFAGVINGPWLYGRGAFDMKSVGIAQLLAFLDLAASGQVPSRSVILLATSGEEVGSDLGMRWVLDRHPELVERFGVVLTEGGAVEGREPGKVKYWGTEFVQKRVLAVTLCGDGRERLEELAAELKRESRASFDVRLTPEAEAFFSRYAPTRDREDWRRYLASPWRLLHDREAFARLSPFLKAMLRNEVVTVPVREVEGGYELEVSVQLVPGADPAAVLAEWLPPWRVHGLAMSVFDEGAADHGSPLDHPVLTAIEQVLGEHYPQAPVGPLLLPWTRTDARFLRARGIPAYGFSPFMVLTPEVLQIVRYGTINERIVLPGYVEGVSIYADLLRHLTGLEMATKNGSG